MCEPVCACIHAYLHGQGGVSLQGSSALLGMHGILTTGRKQKEKDKTLEEKGM